MKISAIVDESNSEVEKLSEQVDELVGSIAKIIAEIAKSNDDFVCTTCLNTAKNLYELLKKHAREEDLQQISTQFEIITEMSLEE